MIPSARATGQVAPEGSAPDGAVREALFAALSRRWFYRWTILAVAGLGMFASGPGQ